MNKRSIFTEFFNGLGRRLAYFYVRHLVRSEIEWGLDVPDGPKIIAANHPTTTDPFLMMSWPFEPIYILITEDAFKVPAVGQFLHLAGHIPVYARRGCEAFDAALALLKAGHTVGIFPEGTLTEGYCQLGPTHSGAVRLATSAKAPIIPMGIALDRHFVFSRSLNQFGVKEPMRWFWMGAYEVSMGKALLFEHDAGDREAVNQSTGVLTRAIETLMQRSAKRLLDSSWPSGEIAA
jgi:1-acyl-sn-glycerol-3-phosphate acyltransferase